MNYDLRSYAMDFASFAILKLGAESDSVKSVVLFGSVARGDSSPKSDVDIFIDVISDEKELSKKIESITEEFYKSARFLKYWKLLNVNNEIKPVVGKLDEWKDLKKSIIFNGVVLYGRFLESSKRASKKILLLWENIKPQSRRVTINKQVFGYTHYGKKYGGLLSRYKGLKLGKGVIQVPLESYPVFMKLFRKHNIAVKIRYVLE